MNEIKISAPTAFILQHRETGNLYLAHQIMFFDSDRRSRVVRNIVDVTGEKSYMIANDGWIVGGCHAHPFIYMHRAAVEDQFDFLGEL